MNNKLFQWELNVRNLVWQIINENFNLIISFIIIIYVLFNNFDTKLSGFILIFAFVLVYCILETKFLMEKRAIESILSKYNSKVFMLKNDKLFLDELKKKFREEILASALHKEFKNEIKTFDSTEIFKDYPEIFNKPYSRELNETLIENALIQLNRDNRFKEHTDIFFKYLIGVKELIQKNRNMNELNIDNEKITNNYENHNNYTQNSMITNENILVENSINISSKLIIYYIIFYVEFCKPINTGYSFQLQENLNLFLLQLNIVECAGLEFYDFLMISFLEKSYKDYFMSVDINYANIKHYFVNKLLIKRII